MCRLQCDRKTPIELAHLPSSTIMNNALLSSGQNRLNLALSSAHIGTWEWEVHTDVIWWDEQMHTLFGLAAGTFTGRREDFFGLLHEEDRERARGEIARTIEDCAEFDGEFRTVRPSDGSVRFLRMRWKVHYDENAKVSRIIGVAWDITERRTTELALAKERKLLATERNLLRSVINNIPDPIFVKDSQGRYLLDNLAHRHSVGKQHEEEIIGKTVFDFFSETSALNFRRIDETILKSGVPMINYEEEAIWPDGTRRWLLTTKVPLRDEAQTVIVCIKRDITERKRADEELARLTQELVAKNEALQEDLEMARELQSALLPQRFPRFPHDATQQESAVRFYHFFQPSMIVSGDFFDVLDISDDKAGLFICDVMGHGVRAALVAATIRSLLSELRPLWTDPGEFLVRLNRALVDTLKNSTTTVFASAFYVVADLCSGELCYSNAGHPRPLRVTHTADSAESAPLNGDRPGPALGLIGNVKYQTSRCLLSPRDVILLFTDGLFEVEGLGGLLYDYHQLSRAVNNRAKLPTGELCHSLIAEVQRFSANRKFNDDVCLVAMEFERLGR